MTVIKAMITSTEMIRAVWVPNRNPVANHTCGLTVSTCSTIVGFKGTVWVVGVVAGSSCCKYTQIQNNKAAVAPAATNRGVCDRFSMGC